MGLINLIKEDCIGYEANGYSKHCDVMKIIYRYVKTPGFRVTCFMRICKYLEYKSYLRIIYWMCRLVYRRCQVKYGIQIGHRLNIGGGFTINHYGGIVIGENAVIGRNFSIRNNLTIGHSKGESPQIGNNVVVGANVCIIGGVHVESNVVIGAGSVIVKNIPENAIVAGNPGKIIRIEKELGEVF